MYHVQRLFLSGKKGRKHMRTPKRNHHKNGIIYVLFFLITLCIDQLTKFVAYQTLRLHGPKVIIKDVLELQYLENRSAAFGVDPITLLNRIFHFSFFENEIIFENAKTIFFVILTLVVLFLMIRFLRKVPQEKKYYFLIFDLLLFMTGAIGNFIDRILHRYVIDFIYFKWINFPIFNVADIYVTVSAVGLIILCLFYYKEKDFEQIFQAKGTQKE